MAEKRRVPIRFRSIRLIGKKGFKHPLTTNVLGFNPKREKEVRENIRRIRKTASAMMRGGGSERLILNAGRENLMRDIIVARHDILDTANRQRFTRECARFLIGYESGRMNYKRALEMIIDARKKII
ncbi:MAG: hypothetical protein AABW68_02970 [archaeon]|mgnify:FL=1